MKVFAKSTDDEKVIGTVTSGTFSPTLKNAIALALIDQDSMALNQVFIDVRGKRLAAQIVNLPFVPAKVREVPQ
jgi:aminomethyltransferase